MRKAHLLILAASAMLLPGCGDDRPYSGPNPNVQSSPAPSPLAESPATPPPASDPLTSGAGSVSADDPLLGHSAPAARDPLAGDDPLKGRAMPTDHSHWLRGRVQNARMTVLLNGVRQGDYGGFVDQDITMQLRRGINTVSFRYTPHQAGSSAQMDLVESEHHPAIAPLASFRSLPQPNAATEFKPTTQQFTFFAH